METSGSQPTKAAKVTMPSTRSATETYLAGQPASSIGGRNLPTTPQVMKFVFHVVKESANRQDAFKETVRNVLSGTWPASKPFQRGCQEKLARLWDQWRSLQKSKSKAAQDKVEKFKSELDLLREIGASDAI